jgi:hypothetical protein
MATATATATADIDNLSWDDWGTDAAALCAIENGADCVACEG